MEMARHNFGLVNGVEPESLGVPGKRVFRLLIDGSPPAAATLWIEKEQLYGLSVAIKKLLESEPWKAGEGAEGAGVPFVEDEGMLKGSSREAVEFKVGRLGLAFGPGTEHVTLFFHDALEEEEDPTFPEGEEGMESMAGEEENPPRAKLQITLKVSASVGFVDRSLELCASGRGTDSVSRQALVAAGKVNPNSNGHFKH
ncbi:MAG: hypothetical protein CMH76_01640 [Nitrospinae bacterium]|jgi:hypothetical protein|nr:hypothetical protein [Nitrospinota bacterium]|tara:strand:- start:7 stop:603 length:597 start_codon:yes stop_codon:yes gene_type:complete